MRNRHWLVVLAAASSSFAMRCAGDSGSASPPSSMQGGGVLELLPTGGTVELDGLRLVAPPGAVSHPVSVQVRVLAEEVPPEYESLSPLFEFTPAGLTFARPVEVTIRHSGGPSGPAVYWSVPGGGAYTQVQARMEGDAAIASVTHFSRGFVGTPIGAVKADAGLSPADAGSSPFDAGSSTRDAGYSQSDAGTGCPSGQLLCAGACVDPRSDEAHCGACGRVCQTGDCISGVCVPPPPVTAVTVGCNHVCAVMGDRTVRCWGRRELETDKEEYCDPGEYRYPCNLRPTRVPSLTNVSALSLTTSQECALASSGTVTCWGHNLEGQLGIGTVEGPSEYWTPQAVSLSNVVQVETAQEGNATTSDFTCAVRADGTLYCWGGNGTGQLGTGTWAYSPVPSPSQVALTGVRQVAGGRGFACAVVTGGRVWCWGRNDARTLGFASQTDCLGPKCTPTPTLVPGVANVAEVDCGAYHVCVRHTDNTVSCWGDNNYGQLGDGTNTGSYTPVKPSGLSNVKQLSLGYMYSCALRTDGTVWCWGHNYFGELGDGTTNDSNVPKVVSGLSDVRQFSAGGFTFGECGNVCALRGDGSVWCWGNNFQGQLGNGSPTGMGRISGPVRVQF